MGTLASLMINQPHYITWTDQNRTSTDTGMAGGKYMFALPYLMVVGVR